MGGLCCRQDPCIYHQPQAETVATPAEVEALRRERDEARAALKLAADALVAGSQAVLLQQHVPAMMEVGERMQAIAVECRAILAKEAGDADAT